MAMNPKKKNEIHWKQKERGKKNSPSAATGKIVNERWKERADEDFRVAKWNVSEWIISRERERERERERGEEEEFFIF